MGSRVLHVVNGQLTAPSSPADVIAILDEAWNTSAAKHLVVHFHGGLTSHENGVAIANKLAPVYDGTAAILSDTTPTGAFSCFFVWDSGALESVTHNLADIAKDPLFQHMVGKVGLWVLKKISGGIGLRSAGGTLVNEAKLGQDFADYFAGRAPDPPMALFAVETLIRASGDAAVAVRGVADDLDTDQLAQEIEAVDLSTDIPFQDVVTSVANGTSGPQVGQTRTRGIGITASSASPISPQGVERLFDRRVDGTRGLVNWFKVAKAIAEIVIRVIRRHHSHRDHGMYITICEEVLRDLYVDKLGGILWNQMKKDTADAFAASTAGGALFLKRLSEMAAENPSRRFSRITLVGHSTGAVFICNLLDKASEILPGEQFDVIFLAPAVTHERFVATLTAHQALIGNFRQFAMSDALECRGSIVPIAYPHSLLYYVSGLLEWTGNANALIDEPIVGMQRFIDTIPPFDNMAFPKVDTVRQYLGSNGSRHAVWSPARNGAGLNSESHRHGDFDDDSVTLDSIATILRSGF
ncbi:MAG TPA: hypothetical protein VF443_09950 [Nitrospira sp.]